MVTIQKKENTSPNVTETNISMFKHYEYSGSEEI